MPDYHKLVRDKIPEIIIAHGGQPVTHIASGEEFQIKAIEKLQEELSEFLESKNPEELADLLEVIMAVAASLGVSEEKLTAIRAEKAAARGGFKKQIILDRS